MRVRLFLLGCAVFSLSLLVTPPEAQAKVLSDQGKREARVSSINRDPMLDKRSARTANRRAVSKVLRHISSKAAVCRVPTAEAAGQSFGECLRSWGINYTTGSACAGICVAAATGNPVAIAVCAGCLGTAEWIVLGCALKSVLNDVIAPVEGPVASKRPRNRLVRPTV